MSLLPSEEMKVSLSVYTDLRKKYNELLRENKDLKEQLTLTDVGISEEVCKHSDDKWIKDSGGDYFCLACEGEIEA